MELLVQQEIKFMKKRISENVAIINYQFDYLSHIIDRKLTVKEESAVLDIVDKHTPKDKKGNYSTPLFPFDFAWIIYKSKK